MILKTRKKWGRFSFTFAFAIFLQIRLVISIFQKEEAKDNLVPSFCDTQVICKTMMNASKVLPKVKQKVKESRPLRLEDILHHNENLQQFVNEQFLL